MSEASSNKHTDRSTRTRERLISLAQQLFANRGVDTVSLNEITVAAGQKNRHALQHQFGSREGLLQAIVDRHAAQGHTPRRQFMTDQALDQLTPARAAARGLVIPLGAF